MKRDKDKFFNIRQCMLVATEGDAWKVWAKVRPVERLLATGDKNVFVSEHCFGGGRCGLLVVNNSGHPYAGMPTLRKGWRVGSVLTDDPARAKWNGGELTLASGSGVLLMAERDETR